MKKQLLTLIVVLIVLSLSVIYLLKDNSLTKTLENQTIRIGYSIEAPYAFVKPNGEVTGYTTMLAKEIADRLGIKNIEWRLLEFGSLLNEIESNKIDIIATGMFITNDRAKRVLFSEPTFYAKQGLVVAKGNPKKLFSYEQTLNIKNIKIAVLEGSIEESLLRELGFNEKCLVLVPDAQSGKIAVETGLADGFALSMPSLRWMTKNDTSNLIEMVVPFKQPTLALHKKIGYGAVEFQKNDIQLQTAWNKELKKFMGSPKHLEMLQKFCFSKDDLPGTISTDAILNH